jgi:hypothetical protein
VTGEDRSEGGAAPDEAPSADTVLEHVAKNGLTLRVRIHWVDGEAGQALGAAQGRALWRALEVLSEMEVGQGSEE